MNFKASLNAMLLSSIWATTAIGGALARAAHDGSAAPKPLITSTPALAPSPTQLVDGVSTPTPTQAGMVGNCNHFHFVESGQTCAVIAALYGISVAQFIQWNPAAMADCSGLWASTYACVGVAPPTTTTSTPNGIATPTPTQPGMVDNCNKFYFVVSGDNCASISSKSGISLAQFMQWNPSVGSTCTELWLGAYVCISVISAGNGIATPTPIQDGMTKSCKSFYFVKAGDTCASIASSHGISVSSFISWNPAAGATCAGLWANTCAHTVARVTTLSLCRVPDVSDPLAMPPESACEITWPSTRSAHVLPAQYAFKIKALHRPVVRIGPNDVSISDPDFVDAIYAPGPGHKRDKNAKHSRSLGINSSIGGSIAHELHRNRREALNPFFSPQRIHRLDRDLTSKAAQVEDIFASASESGQVLNLSDIYFAFCNDVVHKYCFGNDPNLLSNLHLASARRNNVVSVLGSVKIMFHFSWIRKLLQWLPGGTGAHGMMIFRRRIRAQIDAVLASDSSSDEVPSIFTHLRDSTELPAAEKSAQRLEDEAVLMTMAGTYSPMLSLVVAHYHLLTRPDVMTKLRTELGVRESIPPAAELECLPYLASITQEAHRLTFGLTGRNARVCPDEPIVYKDKGKPGQTYVFPPGTSLSVSTLVIHTDESLFPDPWVFDPGRWLPATNVPASTDTSVVKEQKEEQDAASLLLSRRRRSMLSFMRGPRVCIGRHLANAEIAVLLAVMARWDLELFETDEEDVQYKHDYHVMCPKLGSKGVRVKVKGKWGV
ncbi:hypothetical protein O1611_g6263 [Lasiodiplodia mahajangana]|uniref:Uncharacterized protein n=1 Tax=Lasiodiplodia mahajangana TaxID=1108764 RepID=A0ACC2JJJ3_9PEZI|nr:hypothetical protein O1611_g6263 [Lasiodiplodia mahajangana]